MTPQSWYDYAARALRREQATRLVEHLSLVELLNPDNYYLIDAVGNRHPVSFDLPPIREGQHAHRWPSFASGLPPNCLICKLPWYERAVGDDPIRAAYEQGELPTQPPCPCCTDYVDPACAAVVKTQQTGPCWIVRCLCYGSMADGGLCENCYVSSK